MKNFILGLFFGAILTVAAIWNFGKRDTRTDVVKNDLQHAAVQTREMVEDKLGTSNLTAEAMKDELKRTGKIVRQKAEDAGAAMTDAAADAKITATIKAKLLADSHLASLKISVSTSAGVVTLSGNASSAEHVRKAIQLAMDTDGVHKVISTLQVKD